MSLIVQISGSILGIEILIPGEQSVSPLALSNPLFLWSFDMKTRLKCSYSAHNYEFVIDFVYLTLGLIPPSHYPYCVKGSLETSLESLGYENAKVARRKFRKFLRKTQKAKNFSTNQNRVKRYLINKHTQH